MNVCMCVFRNGHIEWEEFKDKLNDIQSNLTGEVLIVSIFPLLFMMMLLSGGWEDSNANLASKP